MKVTVFPAVLLVLVYAAMSGFVPPVVARPSWEFLL